MITDDEDPSASGGPHGNMLKPFKSLLTYLQGSPNSSGSYSDDRPDEEEEGGEEVADVNGASEMGDDPLSDPLAFDHDYSALEVDTDSPQPHHHHHHNLPSGDNEEEEEDSAEIVFVDINRLKQNVLPAAATPPPLPPPPPLIPSVVVQPLYPKDDRLKPGVETPGGGGVGGATDDGESRSDGSDSGLGSELLNVNAICDQQQQQHETPPIVPVDSLVLLTATPPQPSPLQRPRSALKRSSLEHGDATDGKRARRTVQFENVTIYYFARIQGFVCVPSAGGCTLGMEWNHIYKKEMTLNEHCAEQRRAHRLQLEQNPNYTRSQQSSSDDSDEEASTGSDVDTESTGFLRPVSQKQRRVLLKDAGVRKIEAFEKNDCRVIRTSREICGCRCQGDCDPKLCYCSVNGIKCQVDRPSFPCNCTSESCGNAVGRVEFNPVRVRTHFIHTIMRLDLEDKVNNNRDSVDYAQALDASNNNSRLSSSLAATTTAHTILDVCLTDDDGGGGGRSELAMGMSLLETPISLSRSELGDCYRDEYPLSVAGDLSMVPSSSSSSYSSPSKNKNGAGSQFCNNILQMLGIQTPPPPAPLTPTEYSSLNGHDKGDYRDSNTSTLLYTTDRSLSDSRRVGGFDREEETDFVSLKECDATSPVETIIADDDGEKSLVTVSSDMEKTGNCDWPPLNVPSSTSPEESGTTVLK